MEVDLDFARKIPDWQKRLLFDDFEIEAESGDDDSESDVDECMSVVWRTRCLAFPDHATADGVYLEEFGYDVPWVDRWTERIDRFYDQCEKVREIKDLAQINVSDTWYNERNVVASKIVY